MKARIVTIAALLFSLMIGAAAAEIAAHRALYELSLAHARGDIQAATGTMAYEVTDACEGWVVHQRLAMTLTNGDGQDIDMLSDYTTYESKDGSELRFRSRQTTDGAVTSEVVGEARMGPNGGEAVYTLPEATTKKLAPRTLFPNAHTEALLKAAAAGKKFIEMPLFDGTGADGAQDSSVAIASWTGPAASKWPELATLSSGRVHVAFFDQAAGTQQPEYEVTMRYWDNGVADDLLMDFGDFSMRGKMSNFVLGKKGC